MTEQNQSLKKELKKEIQDFRNLGHSFLRKELSMLEFKGKSGGFGVYAERGGQYFMIRLRIPSGVLSLEQFKLINQYAQKYHLQELHFTTRQTIQLHHLSFDDVCDIMDSTIDEGIYTRGGGGNYPRNVSLSPLSGVAVDEVFDPTKFALLVNEHFLSKITSYHLPRKLKVSFSNNAKDTGNATINDLGFLAVEQDGKPYFKLYLCGGLGNNPRLSTPYDELVDPKEVLYHVEAMTNFFMAEGDYQNKAKARTRYIAMRMSTEELLQKYKEHYKKVKETCTFQELNATLSTHETDDTSKPKQKGILPQRQKDLYTVIIHPVGGIIGIEEVGKLISFLDPLPKIDLRLAMEESLYVRNLSYKEAEQLLELTSSYNTPIPIYHSMSCIGVPTCQIGIAESQQLLHAILTHLKETKVPCEFLPHIHISGCNNSCGTHQIAPLGFAGRRKKINGELTDVYEVFVGGKTGLNETTLGTSYGAIPAKEVPEFLSQLAIELKKGNQTFKSFYQKNVADFKALVDKFSC